MRPVLQIFGSERTASNFLALAGPAQERVRKSMLREGLKPLAEAERAAAPIGKTGSVKASIGSRIMPTRRGGEAKAGINVGKKFPGKIVSRGIHFKQPSGFYAPHAHLVALGTKRRVRSRIGGKYSWLEGRGRSLLGKRLNRGTGSTSPNPFIRRATSASREEVIARMRWAAGPAIGREVRNLGMKTGAPVGGIS